MLGWGLPCAQHKHRRRLGFGVLRGAGVSAGALHCANGS